MGADGNVFEGYWKNGVQHGVGKYEMGGETKYGIWNSGQVDRWLDTRIPADRQLLETALGPHFDPFKQSVGPSQELKAYSPPIPKDPLHDGSQTKLAEETHKQTEAELLKQQEKEEEMLCKICYQQKNGVALIPCGHLFCKDCAQTLTKCPLDTQPISKKVTIFY